MKFIIGFKRNLYAFLEKITLFAFQFKIKLCDKEHEFQILKAYSLCFQVVNFLMLLYRCVSFTELKWKDNELLYFVSSLTSADCCRTRLICGSRELGRPDYTMLRMGYNRLLARHFKRGTVPHCSDMYLTAPLLKHMLTSLLRSQIVLLPHCLP